MKKQVEPRLTLVGAGPGDPELITVKGVKALQSADVVLYDALVSEALLNLIPETTPKFFVGKRKGQHALSQDELNELIMACALQYGHVVRLKGGDPFVFGRGFEEIQAMRAVSIEAEYIPGISSAISVAGLEGIPVTHRGASESFWVIAGTTSARQLSDDLRAAMHTSATIVILMGVSQLEKIRALYVAEGMTHTPVAVIQDGSTAEKKLAIGTMGSIVRQVNENHIGAPATIIIGETVKLHPAFQSRQPDKVVAHLHLSGLL